VNLKIEEPEGSTRGIGAAVGMDQHPASDNSDEESF